MTEPDARALDQFRDLCRELLDSGATPHVLYRAVTEAYEDRAHRQAHALAKEPQRGANGPSRKRGHLSVIRPGTDDTPETYNVGE